MRLNHGKEFPGAGRALIEASRALEGSGIDQGLRELVNLRASQINGCAYCVDMHTKEARARGEGETRLNLVVVWREATCFTERERAALAWTEAVTLVAESRRVADDVYAQASAQFTPSELVALTLAVIIINGWNRLQVSFGATGGDYVVSER